MMVPGDDILFDEDSYYQIFPNFDNHPFIEQNHELNFNHSLGWLVQPWFWMELFFPRDLEGERYPTPEDTDTEEFDVDEEETFSDDEIGEEDWSTDISPKENTETLPFFETEDDEPLQWDSEIIEYDEMLEESDAEEEDEEEPPFDSNDYPSTHTEHGVSFFVSFLYRISRFFNF